MDAFALEGLAQLADLVLHPAFAEEAVARIKAQLLDDITRAEERARVQAGRLLRRALFGEHPMGRPLLGTTSSVESITAEDLKAFHARYFSPANLVISVVSPRSPEEVIGWLTFYFGRRPAGPKPPEGWPAFAPPRKPREAAKTIGKAQAYLYLGQLVEVPEAQREAAEVMNAILSDRLGFDLRERRGLAYTVGSSLVQTRAGWYFVAGLGTREANLEEARAGILETIEALKAKAPREAEVTKTVNGLIGASYRRRMTGIGQAYGLAMEAFRGEALGGDEAWAERLRQVSPEAVRRAAALLKPGEMVVVVVR